MIYQLGPIKILKGAGGHLEHIINAFIIKKKSRERDNLGENTPHSNHTHVCQLQDTRVLIAKRIDDPGIMIYLLLLSMLYPCISYYEFISAVSSCRLIFSFGIGCSGEGMIDDVSGITNDLVKLSGAVR